VVACFPTCLTANLALHQLPLGQQRALITLVLRGLTGSIPSHCSIHYNHSHSLMRARKRQTEERETGKLVKLCSVFFLSKWNCIIDFSFVDRRSWNLHFSLINTASWFWRLLWSDCANLPLSFQRMKFFPSARLWLSHCPSQALLFWLPLSNIAV